VVVFVSYSGILGGAERLLVDYAATLPGDRCVACPEGPLAEACRAAGLPVLRLAQRSLRRRGGVGHLVAHAAEVRRLARDLDGDLVVAWGMRSALAAALAGVPFVFAHNDLLPGPVVGSAVRAAARRARAVVALSETIAAELPAGTVVIHPGVDVDAFDAAAVPSEPPEVLVLGALVEWKRPELALDAVALARRQLPDLRLRLAGAPIDGDADVVDRLRARIQQLDLGDAVELAGQVGDPAGALARAACLLHCAPREPFGLAVLEALAAGRPAIVPAAGGPAEIVDGSCGRLYRPGDAAAAAAALAEVVGDPSAREAMGRAGRRRAREEFDRGTARARFAAVMAGAGGSPGVAAAGGGAPAIVTVTRNSADELAILLGSVARHVPDAEIVVVDCASTDESVAVAQRFPGVRVVALDENVGYGRACNRGLEEVGAPVTALLNPDVELIDGSLSDVAAEATRGGGPERLLAPRVLNRDGTVQDTVHPLPGSTADLIRSAIPPAVVPGPAGVALAPWRARRPRRVGWAVGCALVARTETLRALGPFHPELFLYGEDLELSLHARACGIQTWLWPAAQVIHDRARSTEREFGGEAFERLARGRHDAVRLRQGARGAAVDDAAQAVTFASRLVLKRALGRPADRERRQLAAVRALRRREAR
jgi:glycosyltransferase involved in cell wall biosynthesis/GT2 family glycosyltransferase